MKITVRTVKIHDNNTAGNNNDDNEDTSLKN